MRDINVETRRETVLNGVLFGNSAETVVIAKTGEKELVGSWNERFSYTDEDIDAYLDFAAKNYRHVILAYMMQNVSSREKDFVEKLVRYGQGEKILPFYFIGWVVCTANTAHDWLSGILDNTNDFSSKT
ncbi:MAG: hypothetical protein IJ685_02570 [Selenomonadaceae bacterium]|nr:hypothetical protein [Selenomonadaceae bacterium]